MTSDQPNPTPQRHALMRVIDGKLQADEVDITTPRHIDYQGVRFTPDAEADPLVRLSEVEAAVRGMLDDIRGVKVPLDSEVVAAVLARLKEQDR